MHTHTETEDHFLQAFARPRQILQKLIELANNVNSINFNQKFNVDFATSADVIYWPFNKEFWSDELGYYSILPDNACSPQ